MFWGYKYSLDEDLCLVDYEIFTDEIKGTYPSASMCFSHPFLKPKMKELGINTSRYLDFLQGETDDVSLTHLDYNEIIVFLFKFIPFLKYLGKT